MSTNYLTFEKASDIMSNSDNSQLTLATKKQHVKLSFKYLGQIKKGISEQLQLGLLLYNDELEGVPVAYRNIKAIQSMGKIIVDQSCLHFDIVADFILFKPTVGCTLKGVVNKVGSMFVGCLVYECFNGWMPITQIQGVESTRLMGAELEFTVQEIFSNNKVVSLRGSFLRVIRTVSIPDTPAKNKTTFDDDGNVIPKSIGMVETPTGPQMEPIMSSTRIEQTPEKSKKKKKHKKDKSDVDTSGYLAETEQSTFNNTSVPDGVGEEMDSGLGTEESSHSKKKKHKKKSYDLSSSLVGNTADVSGLNNSLEGKDESQTKPKHKKKKSKKMDTSEKGTFDNDIECDSSKHATVKPGTVTEVSGQSVQEKHQISVDSMLEKAKKKKKKRRRDEDSASAEDNVCVDEPPRKRAKTDKQADISDDQGEMNRSKSKKKHKHKERNS